MAKPDPSPLCMRMRIAGAKQLADQILDIELPEQIFAMLDELKLHGYVFIHDCQIKKVGQVSWGNLMTILRKEAGQLKTNKFEKALMKHWNLLEQREVA